MAKKTICKCVCDICKIEYDPCLNFEITIKGDLSQIDRFDLGDIIHLQSLFEKGISLDLCPDCAAQPIASIINRCRFYVKADFYEKEV